MRFGTPSLLRSAAVSTTTLRRHRPAAMLELPPLEVDGLVAITLPVLLVPALRLALGQMAFHCPLFTHVETALMGRGPVQYVHTYVLGVL